MSQDDVGPSERKKSVALRWAIGVGVGAMVAVSLILLFLLAQATDNRALYERNYVRLLVLNMGVAVLLLAVIAWMAFRLLARLRQGKFGSRLLVKLAAIFALVGVLPGSMIYVVSYQFVARSIESWFDVRVESALDAGVALGRSTLDSLSADLVKKTRQAASQLAQTPDARLAVTLEHLREQLLVTDAVLWSASGQVVASAGSSRFLLQPERPSSVQFRQARTQLAVTQVDGLDESSGPNSRGAAHIKALVAVNSADVGALGSTMFLQVSDELPSALAANALAVQQAHRQYQERALARDGLKKMYIGTLTLTLFLAVFGAVLLAVLLGNQLARPLLLLAQGVKQVALGDLGPKAALQSNDELSGLTRAFADMTQQLADAREAVLSAQRAQAWGEVARRLAHEIKNPLTPIRLSAERLGLKLSGKVPEPEQVMLTKAVKTIVDQVDALGRLVDEFRDYARLPAAQLQPVDLNALVGDVMHLYASDNAVVPVHTELDPACPTIHGDAQQLRQVIHNLLQNAQDAVQHLPSAQVLLKTEYVAATQRVCLSVLDTGTGFAEHILKRAFEPYITTKTKGTGLGLAVVKKIADEHGARIDISNQIQDGAVCGAKVSLSFAVAN